MICNNNGMQRLD